MSKFTIAAVILLGVTTLSGCDLFLSPSIGEVTDTWVTTNNNFKIRVIKHKEKNGGFVAGAYYAFHAAKKGQENWIEIMVVRHDDPIEIPRQQVRFVSGWVGYIFMNYKFAVTTDGGATWAVWDAVKNLPDWKLTRAYISDVHVEPSGSGTMKLASCTNIKAPVIYTEDFGKTWLVTAVSV